MNLTAKLELINNFSLLANLNEADRIRLAGMMEESTLPRYTFIYSPGELSNKIFFLSKGSLKIATHNKDGKEVIKRLIHPEALFGERALVGEEIRCESAQSLKDPVTFYTVRVEDFQKILVTNPAMSADLLNLFGRRLMAAENKLESLIFKDARSRIIDFLHEVVTLRGHRVGYEMLLKHSLTHQDIANITCTSRQTVTLVLNELRKDNLIYFNRGRILVRDLQQLGAIA
jgi:CRP/FNR family cyclic AMP-dependent transcriptional regulator